ncbi:MAG: hypothetical protein M9947_16680 [Thermomicrobiales bacterium]|nr:hypothetical protein [Thermomicrobiales bacterium]
MEPINFDRMAKRLAGSHMNRRGVLAAACTGALGAVTISTAWTRRTAGAQLQTNQIYVSPDGWSLQYDPAVWTLQERSNGQVQMTSGEITAYLSKDAQRTNPTQCAGFFQPIAAGIVPLGVLQDANGNDVHHVASDLTYGAYGYEYEGSFVQYTECRSMGASNVMTMYAILPMDQYWDLLPTVETLFAGVTLPNALPGGANSGGAIASGDGVWAALDGLPISVLRNYSLVAEETRTRDDLMNRSLDPALTGENLDAWGFTGNDYRRYGGGGNAAQGLITDLEISILSFDSPASASQALDYFANERMIAGGLSEVVAEQIGDRTRTITGTTLIPNAFGQNEASVYVQVSSVMARISAATPAPNSEIFSIAGSTGAIAKEVVEALRSLGG